MGSIFNDGRMNVHDEVQSGRPSVITEDLFQKVEEKVKQNRCLTIPSLSDEFCRDARSVLHNQTLILSKVDEKVKNRCFTILSLSHEFCLVARIFLPEVVTKRLNYWTLRSRWVRKMLTDVQKTKSVANALTFHEQ